MASVLDRSTLRDLHIIMPPAPAHSPSVAPLKVMEELGIVALQPPHTIEKLVDPAE